MSPLADLLRPSQLADFIGQPQLVGSQAGLYRAIANQRMHSMIFWGPPGTGKTTLAQLISAELSADYVALSAVMCGVKEVRAVIQQAELAQAESKKTILFLDEIHRFNKAQQDALLPAIEAGVIYLIGATTENPSFALNNALLSRARLYVFKSHDESALRELLTRALTSPNSPLSSLNLGLTKQQVQAFLHAADGDARRLLNLLEAAADFVQLGQDNQLGSVIPDQDMDAVLAGSVRRFDNKGDDFYDLISALHKSVRGSSPDAALYWLARMLDAGCDPLYIARRLIRIAAEDIGNADPRALSITTDAAEMMARLGSPEGELGLAQAVLYLASCAKSNAVYRAFNAAMSTVKSSGSLPVPMHLRNAPTASHRAVGAHQGYRYAHDEPEAYVAGEQYLPDALLGHKFYEPTERGLEKKIKEKLSHLQQLDKKAANYG